MILTAAMAFVADLVTIGAQIVRSALGQFGRQIMMSDKRHARRHGRVAEDVIRMFMRIDHVADRLVGDAADGQEQTLADSDAATGVDECDGVLSDDDAEIGDVAGVVWCRKSDLAEMHVVAVSDFLHVERRLRRAPPRHRHNAQVTT